ncbi:hypothetical protein [Neotabrizicola sp. VNH66]|uniref:hypothetical protein n=1 Tax=Neotabrizicola sp. VNH66 TaxID=3400918 RepID=UPI003C047BA5
MPKKSHPPAMAGRNLLPTDPAGSVAAPPKPARGFDPAALNAKGKSQPAGPRAQVAAIRPLRLPGKGRGG